MVHLSSLPPWQALHPVVVHFPIALLLVAPLFVVIGAAWFGEKARSFLLAALVLIALGTAGTFVAQATGDAASKVAFRSAQINLVLENHEELAETTSILFSVLTVIFAAIVLGPGLMKWRDNRTLTTALPLTFLVLYAAGAVLLINTAHDGGRLVHELGVRTQFGQPQTASTAKAVVPAND